MYQLLFSKTLSLKKDIKNLKKNKQMAIKIKNILEEFRINPFSSTFNIKILQPKYNERYRIRIADWRVIYSIDLGNKIIIIHRIGQRKNIYK